MRENKSFIRVSNAEMITLTLRALNRAYSLRNALSPLLPGPKIANVELVQLGNYGLSMCIHTHIHMFPGGIYVDEASNVGDINTIETTRLCAPIDRKTVMRTRAAETSLSE